MPDEVDDEIDLIELIENIWDGKWLIGAITGIFALLSVFIVLNLPPSFEGSIDIVALNKTQMAAYAPLNDLPDISKPIYAGNKLVGHEGIIFSENLFKAFIAKLRLGRSFSEAHAEIDPDFINFDGTETDRRETLFKLRENYQISIDKSDPLRGTLKFSTGNKKLARAIVARAFMAVNDELRLENLRGIADLRRSIAFTLAFETDEIETAIENAATNYEISTAARVANLTEQAAIARQLGITDNQAGLAARGENGIGINVNSELPLYLRGFKALEKEIALINNRGTGDALLPYIPNYPELAIRLRKLKSDKRLERISQGIELTPFANAETFAAVEFGLEAVIFKSTTSKGLIIILATLMGGVFAVIFVLTRQALAKRNQTA